MPNAQDFKNAWGKYASSVSVITSIEPGGTVHGMAASDISSVSLDPMLVLVCVGHNRNSHPLIESSGRFAINIMSDIQEDIVLHFAKSAEHRDPDFEIQYLFTSRGAAFIEGAIAQMDCRVIDQHTAGDHTIFIGEVEEIEVADNQPLLYYQGNFGRFNPKND